MIRKSDWKKIGYSQREREIIISEGVSRYTNIVKQSVNGSRPIYRSSQWQKEDRAVKRLVKAKTWSKADSVMFVQATPGELLKKEISKIMHESGLKVRVVEKAVRKKNVKVYYNVQMFHPLLCVLMTSVRFASHLERASVRWKGWYIEFGVLCVRKEGLMRQCMVRLEEREKLGVRSIEMLYLMSGKVPTYGITVIHIIMEKL